MTKRTILLVAALLLLSVLGLAQTPVPFINQPLVPATIAPGGPQFALTVNGTGFVEKSVVKWNGKVLATSFVSASQLTAIVPATHIAHAGTASVTVINPRQVPATSNVAFLPITISAPTVAFSKTEVATGSSPEGAATGDFNGGGRNADSCAYSGAKTCIRAHPCVVN